MRDLVKVLKSLPSASNSRRYVVNVANTLTLYLLEEGYGRLKITLAENTGLLGDLWYEVTDYSTLTSFNLKTLPTDLSPEDLDLYTSPCLPVDALEALEGEFKELVDVPYSSFPSKSLYVDLSGRVYGQDRDRCRCITHTDERTGIQGSWYNASVLNAANSVRVYEQGLGLEIRKCPAVYEGIKDEDPLPGIIMMRHNTVRVPFKVRPSKAYTIYKELASSTETCRAIDGKIYSTLKCGAVLEVEEAYKFFAALKKVEEVLDGYYHPEVSLLEVVYKQWSHYITTWNPTQKS